MRASSRELGLESVSGLGLGLRLRRDGTAYIMCTGVKKRIGMNATTWNVWVYFIRRRMCVLNMHTSIFLIRVVARFE